MSKNSNQSTMVLNEINCATNHNKLIIPLQIEDVRLSKALEFYIGKNNIISYASENSIDRVIKMIGNIVEVEEDNKITYGGPTVLSANELSIVGYDCKKLVVETVEIDYRTLANSLEDYVIDESIEGQPDEWYEYAKSYPETASYLVVDDKVVGYSQIEMISDENYESIITGKKMIKASMEEFYGFGGELNCYIAIMPILEEFATQANYLLLVDDIFNKFVSFHKNYGVIIKRIGLSVYSSLLEKMVTQIGFVYKGLNEAKGKIFELDLDQIRNNKLLNQRFQQFYQLYIKDSLTYEIIDSHNYEEAVKIQNKIFPLHNAKNNYYESVNGIIQNKYYIVKKGNVSIGIYGLYSLKNDPDSAWLGWFGILSGYRKQGFGRKVIDHFEKQAINEGYKYARFYTDEFDNELAIAFYKKLGYELEPYDNRNDPACYDYPVLIGTKSLRNEPLKMWCDKSISFTDQICKQTNVFPKLLQLKDLDEVTFLYERCFLDNSYFRKQFSGMDLKELMDTSFKTMFKYCISKNKSYGIFRNNRLIGFYLCFDYFEAKNNDLGEFNNIFTCNPKNSNYPYQNEFHNQLTNLKGPVMYLLAICIEDSHRGNGYAKQLINHFIVNNHDSSLIADVTNVGIVGNLKKKGFSCQIIDDGYYLLMREK